MNRNLRAVKILAVMAILFATMLGGCVDEGMIYTAPTNSGGQVDLSIPTDTLAPSAMAGNMAVANDGIILSAEAAPNEYIVQLKDEAISAGSMSPLYLTNNMAQATNMVLAHHQVQAKVLHVYDSALKGFAAKMTREEAASLLQNPSVKSVQQATIIRLSTTQSSAVWGLDRIDQSSLPLNGTYSYTNNGAGVHIYIIDAGIRLDHTQFSGRMGTSWGFDGSGDSPAGCEGHGTHVAGTAAGSTYGVAKGATVHAVRVFGCTGATTSSAVLSGINWVMNNHQSPAVANMSLGGARDDAMDTAVQNAINSGVTFVAAAGNDSKDACLDSPGRGNAVITVGATTSEDERSSFSNFGSCVDIFAPGSYIKSAYNTSSTATTYMPGTSMASPHVAGVAALYLQSNPNASPATVFSAVINGAVTGKISGVGLQEDSISGAQGSKEYRVFVLNTGTSSRTLTISGGTGDCDLYVKNGGWPTESSYDCRPWANGNNESCTLSADGAHYIMLVGYNAYAGVKLDGDAVDTLPTGSPNKLLQSNIGGSSSCTPSCVGDLCGQADGCGGYCSSADVNTCGKCGNSSCCTPSCYGDLCGQADGCGGYCSSADVNTCGKCGNSSCCTPSCVGDLCGQSDGCGGTCSSADASSCGKCGNAACDTGGTCDPFTYSASGTNNASYADSDTDQFAVNLTAGVTYTFQTCGTTSTDTYLRLHLNGVQKGYNDDSCNYQSSITYKPTVSGEYVISAGCYGGNSCNGEVLVSPAPSCGDGGSTCTPSCVGDLCGQSDGCGSTCSSADANSCGKCGNAACDTGGGSCDDIMDSGLSGVFNSFYRYTITGTNVSVSTTGTGYVHIYVKLGSDPDRLNYDCKSENYYADESLTCYGSGTWHVLVWGNGTHSNVSMDGSVASCL